MKVNKIQFGIGYTLNLGNYESMRFDVQLEGLVEEGEDQTDAFLELENNAKILLITSMSDALEKLPNKQKYVEDMLGLEVSES